MTAVHEIERPGGTIVFHATGSGTPLLLLHATLSSSRQLRGLAARLSGRFRVLSVDRRGSGDSIAAAPRPPAPIDVAVHVADLDALVHTQELAPVALVGHSYGGCLALEFAARCPTLVRSVVAWEPPYGPLAHEATRTAMAAVGDRTLAAAERGDLPGAALEFMAGVSGPAAVAALSAKARERIGRAGTGAVADATLLGMDPSGLSAIRCPVLIGTGADSDPVYAHIAAALAASIPDATSSTIDGVDHMAPITAPDVVAAMVLDFCSP